MRLALFALGAGLLAWTVLSLAVVISFWLPLPGGLVIALESEMGNGTAGFVRDVPEWVREPDVQFRSPGPASALTTLAGFDYFTSTSPGYSGWTAAYVTFPLWLLAAVCLAWPITSFVLERRRRGGGFEVEPASSLQVDPAGSDDAPGAAKGFVAGDLVSVVTEEGFGVVKVLAADEHGVHARLYVQRFRRRPAGDVGALSIAPFGRAHKNPFSIGHMPLSHASFADWSPQLIRRGDRVTEQELDGYRMWQEAEAGYF